LLADVLALFLLLALLARSDNAAIAFAVIVYLVFLSRTQCWLSATVTGGIMAAWTYGFMSYFMAVVWPEPVLGQWMLGLL
jgi:hypothetical protein